MLNHRRHILLAGLAVTASMLLTPVTWAADYPERPIELIVPFAAGGGQMHSLAHFPQQPKSIFPKASSS